MTVDPETPRQTAGMQSAWNELLAAAGRGIPASAAASSWIIRSPGSIPRIRPDAPAEARDLVSLYLPLCMDGTWRVGHLGQSLDGCIATHAGESRCVTGPDNILHLHRMRALCDVVLVGAGTVASDDPRLTTRLVPGPNPVRVVLDPKGRLGSGHHLFRDTAAPTLLCVAAGAEPVSPPGQAELLVLPADAAGLRLDVLLARLAARGLKRIFVEGGGVTVSRFLAAGLLSRLQIAVAPLIIGGGRPGLSLPRTERLADALRLAAPRIFRMGADVFYDLDLSGADATAGGRVLSADPSGTTGVGGVLRQVL